MKEKKVKKPGRKKKQCQRESWMEKDNDQTLVRMRMLQEHRF